MFNDPGDSPHVKRTCLKLTDFQNSVSTGILRVLAGMIIRVLENESLKPAVEPMSFHVGLQTLCACKITQALVAKSLVSRIGYSRTTAETAKTGRWSALQGQLIPAGGLVSGVNLLFICNVLPKLT